MKKAGQKTARTSYIFAEELNNTPLSYPAIQPGSNHVKTDKQQRSSRNRSAAVNTVDPAEKFNEDLEELWRAFGDHDEPVKYHDDNGKEFWLLSEFHIDCPEFEFDAAQDKYIPEDTRSLLQWSIALLNASPTARQLIKEAVREGWSIALGDCNGYDFHLDVNDRRIILDDNGLSAISIGKSDYFRHTLLFSLVRALRDVWQEKRHGGFDEEYGPEAILMLERVRAADCDVMAILAGWELRSENYGGFWRYLIGSDEGDMAMAFSTYLEHDPSSMFSGAALAKAFDQWFKDQTRVDACDHETLEYLDTLTQEQNSKPAFGKKSLRAIGVEILSCLPDRTAYLKGRGREILSNPMYAGLNDHINQTHLAQILYDMNVTYVQGIPFRDADLAGKIFPGGAFMEE